MAAPSGIFALLNEKNLVRRFKAGDIGRLLRAAQGITLYAPPEGKAAYRFFWRGQHDIGWGLSSRLYRDCSKPVTRKKMDDREEQILAAFARTQLPESELPLLKRLATLQHHGAPTRLIDVSTDYLPALYFACEDAARETGATSDGLLLAFLVPGPQSDLETDEMTYKGQLRDAIRRDVARNAIRYYVPPPLNARIRAQRGAFIVGDEPRTSTPDEMSIRWKVPPRPWTEEKLEQVLNPEAPRKRGRPGTPFIIGLCIERDLKREVLDYLDRVFRINANVMFPDIQGFAESVRR